MLAALIQIGQIITPLAYLISGPLADRVFEPAVGKPWWSALQPLVGSSPGSGMGLMIFISGLLTFTAAAVVYLIPSITRMEENLPDYEPRAQSASDTES